MVWRLFQGGFRVVSGWFQVVSGCFRLFHIVSCCSSNGFPALFDVQDYFMGRKIRMKDNIIYIDEQKVETYIFQYDYFFMMGDHRYDSRDSRYIGPVPENRIFIKSRRILFSNKDGFKYSRILQKKREIINTKGEQLDNFAIPNNIFSNLWEDIGFSDNPIIINYNPDEELIIVGSRFTDDIACIDENGAPVFQIDELEIENDPDWSMSKGSSYRSFYSIDTDERFIYCLYAGGYILRYDKKLNRGVANYPNRLLVFNWTGAVKYDIKLDHPLMSFSLDKKRKRIIGSTQDFENGLVAYDLSMLY